MASLQEPIAQLERGEAAAAIRALEERLERTPLHVTACVLLARAYEAEARWPEAHRAWQRAYFLMPSSPVVVEGLHRTGEEEALAAEAAAAAPEPPSEPAPPERTPPEPVPPEPAPEEAPERDAPKEDVLEEEAPEDAPPSPPVFSAEASDDLDSLISELEGARITPRPDLEDLPAPDLDDDLDDLVSETLARIYVAQEQYADAARVYARLAEQDPARAHEHREKAATLRARAEEG